MLANLACRLPAAPLGLQVGLSHLTPHGRLLVLLARTSVNGTLQVEITDQLREYVDWATLLCEARSQGVVPLAHRTLLAYDPGTIPREIREALNRHTQLNAEVANQAADELIALLEAFTARGVQIIPFKGPISDCMAYGDSTLRECDGLDFFVEESSRTEARQVLWSREYQLAGQASGQVEVHEPLLQSFVKSKGNIQVHLRCVLPRRSFASPLDQEHLWKNVTTIKVSGRPVPTLRAEELLLALCVHGTTHAWSALKQICDVAELLHRRRTLDWSRMVYLARKWRCHRMLLMGLAMARTVYDAPLPRSVQHTIMTDPDIPSLIKRVPKGLLQRTEEGIDETDAEALCLLLKDSCIERYRFGLALCRAKSSVVTKSLPWFRLQDRLQTLAQWFRPFHGMANQCVRLRRIAKCLPRWRVLPG